MRCSQPLNPDGCQFVDIFSERITNLEGEFREHKEDVLPLLGGIETLTKSINESLLDIKEDLKEVRGDVRLLSEGQQGLILDFQSINAKVVTLETIESDRKERRKLIVKAVFTTAGTVAAAIVIWYFGLK